MPTALRFREHERFQKSALAMVIAGGLAGAVGWVAFRSGAAIGSIALVACATLIAGMGLRPWRRPLHSGGRPLVLDLAVLAIVAALAHHALVEMALARELASLPGAVSAAIAGAAFAAVATLALAVRHVHVVVDPVARAYAEVGKTSTGEVLELAVRAHGVWAKAVSRLPEGDTNRELLEEAVLRVFETARKWSATESSATENTASALTERMESLDQRIAGSEDEVVKGQYRQAREALAEQLRYLKEIGTARERVLARIHNDLASMEQLRLAVINLDVSEAR